MQFLRRLLNLFSRSRVDREIAAEIQSHIDLRIEDNLAVGMSPADARRDALLRFGNPTATRERVASADLALGLTGFWSDLRHAARQLLRSPGFTITAVLTLALAIGANAVVFSVLNAFLIRPLNVPNPQSLYGLWHVSRPTTCRSLIPTISIYVIATTALKLSWPMTFNQAGLDTGKEPSRVWIDESSGNYFDALGLQPYLGRFFHASDEHGPNSAPYIVLSYDYWHSHFQGDPGVIGRVVRLNKHPFTIIGVTRPGFHGTLSFFHPDLFEPHCEPRIFQRRLDDRPWQSLGLHVHGAPETRHFPGAGSRRSELCGCRASEKTYPKDDAKMTFKLARPSLYGDFIGRPVREFMTGLMLLTGLILLAACTNLGGLFAARAADRSREVALRLALGSSRRRILRGFFAEALLISLLGGAIGLWAASCSSTD